MERRLVLAHRVGDVAVVQVQAQLGLNVAAGDLDASRDHTGAVRTTLLLAGAYSAATGQDRSTALSLLQEAERHPAVPDLVTVEARRTQVDVYRISVRNALGTPDEAVRVARWLNVERMPTRPGAPERRLRTQDAPPVTDRGIRSPRRGRMCSRPRARRGCLPMWR